MSEPVTQNINGQCTHWTQMMPLLAYKDLQGQNSSTTKVTLSKFVVEVSFLVIIIEYKIHNIWFKLNKDRQ